MIVQIYTSFVRLAQLHSTIVTIPIPDSCILYAFASRLKVLANIVNFVNYFFIKTKIYLLYKCNINKYRTSAIHLAAYKVIIILNFIFVLCSGR